MRGARNSCSYEKVPIGIPQARHMAGRSLLGYGAECRHRSDRTLCAGDARIDWAYLLDARFDLGA